MYVQVNINMYVREQVIVRVMVRFVKVNTQNVIARLIMCGMVVLVFVTAVSNIVAVVQVIVPEVGYHAGANIRVVIVRHITVGMAVHVHMYIVMCARAGIQPRVRGW